MPLQSLPDTAQESLQLRLTAERHGQRLDSFLAEALKAEGISRERGKQLIKQGMVNLNGLPCTLPRQELRAGDEINLILPADPAQNLKAEEGKLCIIYEDSDLLILNKPPRLTVHPCPSCPEGTLVNILLHHFPQLASLPGLRPGVVHRLDKNTSGLLLIALSEQVRLKLSEAFAAREVHKKYLALVSGVLKEKCGRVNAPMARHPKTKTRMAVVPHGKEAITDYRVLYQGADFALLEVTILTGRTHQIRVHLAHLGHPIWGDTLYGGPSQRLLSLLREANGKKTKTSACKDCNPPLATRQMLHACSLNFTHPQTGKELAFTCPLPADFINCLQALLASPVQLVITGLPGCGKSALLQALAAQQIPVWSADKNVAEEYLPGANGWQLLASRFRGRFIDPASNILNKQELFAAMCASPELKKEVEALIHPLIRHNLDLFWHAPFAPEDLKTGIKAAEVPLYLEASWNNLKNNAPANTENENFWAKALLETPLPPGLKLNPKAPLNQALLLGVACPQETRYARLAQRGVPPHMAAQLDAWQWPEAAKLAACNLIIDNSGSLQDLQAKAKALHSFLNEVATTYQKLLSRHILKACPLD